MTKEDLYIAELAFARAKFEKPVVKTVINGNICKNVNVYFSYN